LEGVRHEAAESPQEEKESEMSLLLDTHYVYALSGSPGTLSKREAAFLKAYAMPFVVSAVSIWEIRIKWNAFDGSGKRKAPADPKTVLQVLTGDFVDFLLLTPEHASLELKVSIPHRDPFDELLLAQAQAEGLNLLSRDRKLIGHPLVMEID
jgi:PIN domain nuclease of toxin-antitoxin system